MATIPWIITAITTGCNLVCYVNWTIAIYWSMSQTGHNPHSFNPVNYQRHLTGHDLVCYVNCTIAIYWSMPQTGHNPHGFNPMNFQRYYNWAWSCLLCQLDNSNLLINVSNRTRSTWLQSRELSMPLPLGAILFAMSTGQ